MIVDEFLKEIEKFFSYCDSEFTANVRKEVALELCLSYDSVNPKHLSRTFEQILRILAKRFPTQVEHLEPLEVICLKAKSIEVI